MKFVVWSPESFPPQNRREKSSTFKKKRSLLASYFRSAGVRAHRALRARGTGTGDALAKASSESGVPQPDCSGL